MVRSLPFSPGLSCLLIRADSSPQIGTGHIMRCLALAQAWQDAGGRVVFAMAMEAVPLETRLQSERMEVVHLSAEPGSSDDAIQTADLARQMHAPWVVVDGYHFGACYQRLGKESGLRLLFIDDNGHADHYYADIVLNQNLHAHEDLYQKREPYTRLLLGPRYVLLRREFTKWRGWHREIAPVARKVLVTLGGGDPENVTLQVVQALHRVPIDRLEALVVVGPGNPHSDKLRSSVRSSCRSVRLESNLSNMVDCIAWADLAIAGAGCTIWELLFMGTPTLTLIMAENQRLAAEELGRRDLAKVLGWGNTLSLADLTVAIMSTATNQLQRAALVRRAARLPIADGLKHICTAMYPGQ